ncbi:hypothetical protein [Mycolicibacterium vulneris]|uniref:hypothetical protein n=1 Tax=Mycolicibacterium vulneris TaxID=547163 RepID=UPI0013FD814B|nr:hypothetical protein [Mycolicibacterium vulneris]
MGLAWQQGPLATGSVGHFLTEQPMRRGCFSPSRSDASFITLGVFVTAALVALRWPVAAMVLVVLCLVGYLRPDIPQRKNVEH